MKNERNVLSRTDIFKNIIILYLGDDIIAAVHGKHLFRLTLNGFY